MLSLKEIEYLENTISKEIATRKRVLDRLQADNKERTDLQEAHMQLVIKKQKDSLDTHIGIFEKLRSIGGY